MSLNYVDPIFIEGVSVASDGGSIGLYFVDYLQKKFHLSVDRAINTLTYNQIKIYPEGYIINENDSTKLLKSLKEFQSKYPTHCQENFIFLDFIGLFERKIEYKRYVLTILVKLIDAINHKFVP